MKRNVVVKESSDQDPGAAMARAVERLGGLSAFVRPGEKVFLKPNLNTADPFPASSSPDFVAAACDLFHDAGASVVLGDSCTFSQKTSRVMDAWGMDRLKDGRPWLDIVDLDEGKWTKKAVPGGAALRHVSVPAILDEVDRLVLLPCLKTHFLAGFTGALKLSVGFMKPSERIALHARRLQEKIGELNAVIEPDLILMDARKCFITHGPSKGEVREPGIVMASRDRVAIDIEGVRIIQGYEGNDLKGIEPESLPQIVRAIAMGVDAARNV